MDYVHKYTSIPVPRVYFPDLSGLVMEFIDG